MALRNPDKTPVHPPTWQPEKEETVPRKLGGFDLDGSGVMPVGSKVSTVPAEPAISEVEQFCHDQGLTTCEANIVEVVCNHKSASELDLAVAYIRRLQRLAGYVALCFMCLLFVPSCVPALTVNGAPLGVSSIGVAYDAATKTWNVSGAARPTK